MIVKKKNNSLVLLTVFYTHLPSPNPLKESWKPFRYSDHTLRTADLVNNLISLFCNLLLCYLLTSYLSFIYHKLFIINILFSFNFKVVQLFLYTKRGKTNHFSHFGSQICFQSLNIDPKTDLKTKFSYPSSLCFKLMFCLRNLQPSTNCCNTIIAHLTSKQKQETKS